MLLGGCSAPNVGWLALCQGLCLIPAPLQAQAAGPAAQHGGGGGHEACASEWRRGSPVPTRCRQCPAAAAATCYLHPVTTAATQATHAGQLAKHQPRALGASISGPPSCACSTRRSASPPLSCPPQTAPKPASTARAPSQATFRPPPPRPALRTPPQWLSGSELGLGSGAPFTRARAAVNGGGCRAYRIYVQATQCKFASATCSALFDSGQ
jgi:hypothetical protein